MIELHVPAGPTITAALQSQLVAAGARLARPGEFTLRAFLAGRLDLAQAEGVLGLVEADDLHSLRWAIDQRTGGLSRPVAEAREQLLDLLADLEAGLDFADQEVPLLSRRDIRDRLGSVLDTLAALAGKLDQRAWEHSCPRVVLVGPANAGKSSLFNALVGRDAALVSELAGTTRDYVTAPIRFPDELAGGSRPIELVDTAGQCEASDELAQGAAVGREAVVRQADLVLYCLAVDQQPGPAPLGPVPVVRVRTKSDLAPAFRDPLAQCHVSVLDRTGMADLLSLLADSLSSRNPDRPPISVRCQASLEAALVALRDAQSLHERQAGAEFVVVGIREALASLGELVGAVHTDDLLERVFSRFCLGK